MRDLVSAGDSRSQMLAEIRHLSKDDRQNLLTSGGFTLDIPPGQGLAMKADLGIPWNKLRTIRRQGYLYKGTNIQGFKSHRWLKEWGLSMRSEKRQRVAAHELIGDNLEAESIPLTFPLKGGGEEVRAAALCYAPNIVDKVVSLLEENEK